MKRIFLLDELYAGDADYPWDGSYLRRFLYYKGNVADEIDVDVCEKNVRLFLKNNPIFFEKNVRVEPQSIHKKNSQKYQIVMDNVIYRGETLINCLQIILQIINYESEEYIGAQDLDEVWNRLNSNSLADDKIINLLEEYVFWCYNPGNFFAIPFAEGKSLNQAKGRLKERGYGYTFRDSCYTYLNALSRYFKGENVDVTLIRYIDETTQYLLWKERYRTKDHCGVERFISDNQFESFFECGRPKQLWKMTGHIRSDIYGYLIAAISVLKARTDALIE